MGELMLMIIMMAMIMVMVVVMLVMMMMIPVEKLKSRLKDWGVDIRLILLMKMHQ